MQSHDGLIHLLPALPEQWKSGKVMGLKSRGNFTFDMEWRDGKIIYLKITTWHWGNCRLRSSLPLDDRRLKKAAGINPNSLFVTENIKQPLISPKAKIASPSLPMVYEYDLQTEKGNNIFLISDINSQNNYKYQRHEIRSSLPVFSSFDYFLFPAIGQTTDSCL